MKYTLSPREMIKKQELEDILKSKEIREYSNSKDFFSNGPEGTLVKDPFLAKEHNNLIDIKRSVEEPLDTLFGYYNYNFLNQLNAYMIIQKVIIILKIPILIEGTRRCLFTLEIIPIIFSPLSLALFIILKFINYITDISYKGVKYEKTVDVLVKITGDSVCVFCFGSQYVTRHVSKTYMNINEDGSYNQGTEWTTNIKECNVCVNDYITILYSGVINNNALIKNNPNYIYLPKSLKNRNLCKDAEICPSTIYVNIENYVLPITNFEYYNLNYTQGNLFFKKMLVLENFIKI